MDSAATVTLQLATIYLTCTKMDSLQAKCFLFLFFFSEIEGVAVMLAVYSSIRSGIGQITSKHIID